VGATWPARRDHRLVQAGTVREHALSDLVAAVSVGIIDGVTMLDLPYEEDSRAETDMNVVMTGAGHFVEVQARQNSLPLRDGTRFVAGTSRARASPTSTPPASAPRTAPPFVWRDHVRPRYGERPQGERDASSLGGP